MTVHLGHQEIRMMTLVGAAVIKTVGGVWTDLIVNKNHSQSQSLQNKMTGELIDFILSVKTTAAFFFMHIFGILIDQVNIWARAW